MLVQALELAEYYDFGKSWMSRQAFRRAIFRQQASADDDKPEIVLPSGVRLGHRSLVR